MKILSLLKMAIVSGACLLLLEAGTQAQIINPSINVTAGMLYGVGGSTNSIVPQTRKVQYGSEQPDGKGSIYQVLDLGSIHQVQAIEFINRLDTGSNYGIDVLNIRVASDESSPDFDPFSISSYSISLFEGKLLPNTNALGAVRSVNLGGSEHQYFLIEFTKTLRQDIGRGTGLDAEVQFSDITFTQAIPEPRAAFLGSTAVLAIYLIGLRRRK